MSAPPPPPPPPCTQMPGSSDTIVNQMIQESSLQRAAVEGEEAQLRIDILLEWNATCRRSTHTPPCRPTDSGATQSPARAECDKPQLSPHDVQHLRHTVYDIVKDVCEQQLSMLREQTHSAASSVSCLEEQVTMTRSWMSAEIERCVREALDRRDQQGAPQTEQQQAYHAKANPASIDAVIQLVWQCQGECWEASSTHDVSPLMQPIFALCQVLDDISQLYDAATATSGCSLETIFALPPSALPSCIARACQHYLRSNSLYALSVSLQSAPLLSCEDRETLRTAYQFIQAYVVGVGALPPRGISVIRDTSKERGMRPSGSQRGGYHAGDDDASHHQFYGAHVKESKRDGATMSLQALAAATSDSEESIVDPLTVCDHCHPSPPGRKPHDDRYCRDCGGYCDYTRPAMYDAYMPLPSAASLFTPPASRVLCEQEGGTVPAGERFYSAQGRRPRRLDERQDSALLSAEDGIRRHVTYR